MQAHFGNHQSLAMSGHDGRLHAPLSLGRFLGSMFDTTSFEAARSRMCHGPRIARASMRSLPAAAAASAKPLRGNWHAKASMWRSWRATGRDLEATARELAAETNRRIIPLAADVTSREQVETHGRRRRATAGRRAHFGQQRLRAGRLGHGHRTDRDRRRRGSDRRISTSSTSERCAAPAPSSRT